MICQWPALSEPTRWIRPRSRSALRWPLMVLSATSRSQLGKLLDPTNLFIQLDTLIKAASAVRRTVEIRLKRDTKRQRTTSA